jgi:glucuronoarabinoxylan endo-1,4-beta-xylanase
MGRSLNAERNVHACPPAVAISAGYLGRGVRSTRLCRASVRISGRSRRAEGDGSDQSSGLRECYMTLRFRMFHAVRSSLATVMPGLLAWVLGACGGDTGKVSRPSSGAGGSPSTLDAGATEAGMGITEVGTVDVLVTVDTSTRFQTMQGFGASVVFYSNWLTGHPARAAIYDAIFADLGLDILRVGNWYQNSRGLGGFNDAVTVAQAAHASLGQGPLVLMSSWSPPASLKSTNVTTNGGTLARDATGDYAYGQLGQWWQSALSAYADSGLTPDFISLQNEPDFTAAWESCLFAATPSDTRAGYGPALDAVYSAIQGLDRVPQILGPELAGIAGNRLQSYVSALQASGSLAKIGGIAHHLYSGGGTPPTPDGYMPSMGQVATAAGSAELPLFMTEYAPNAPDFFNTALLIHNAVTVEGVSAYLYWALIWAPPASASSPPGGLVTTENPFDPSSWTTTQGYIVNDVYYAMKHFSKWVDAGWQRVAASASQPGVRVSAFESPGQDSVTLVLLNTDVADHVIAIDAGSFAFTSSALFRTSGSAERAASLGPIGPGNAVALPGHGIATVTLGL